MFPRVVAVRALEPYQVELTFTDGLCAVVDLGKWIAGRAGVFEPFHDPAFFSQVQVDPRFRTIVWPNGVDFCPDVLYAEATGAALPEVESH